MKPKSKTGFLNGRKDILRRINMIKRIIAWILIIGFVFLIANILVIHKYTYASAAIYAVIVVCYLLFRSKLFANKNDDKVSEEETK